MNHHLFSLLLLSITCVNGEVGVRKKFSLLMPNVRPTVEDFYLCTSFKVDPASDFYITSFEPNSTMNIAHHMLLLGCTEPGLPEGVYNCGGMAKDDGVPQAPICKSGRQIIYGWARNAPKLILPEGIGFHIGGKTDIQYLVLQVHYSYADSFKDGATDDSGIFIYYTKERQPKSAGVITLGTRGRILPKSTEFFEVAWKFDEDKVIHPFAFRTHTHSLGRVVSGYKVATDKLGKMEWSLIGKKDPMLPQMFYPVNDKKMMITKGDQIAVRCTIVSNRDNVTRVGPSNKDEMCNLHLMYWTDGPTLQQKMFFSEGPPLYYWDTLGELKEIPNEDASSLPVGQTAKELGYDEAAF